jgi:hypothetical protein
MKMTFFTTQLNVTLVEIWFKKYTFKKNGQGCNHMGHTCQFWPYFITTTYKVYTCYISYIINVPKNIYMLMRL